MEKLARNKLILFLVKKTPTQLFFCEHYENFKNTYFEEELQTAASKSCFVYVDSLN